MTTKTISPVNWTILKKIKTTPFNWSNTENKISETKITPINWSNNNCDLKIRPQTKILTIPTNANRLLEILNFEF